MKLVITEIKNPTMDAVTLRFHKQFDYRSGQHAALKFNIEGENFVRTYSFNTSPYTDHDAAITVRAIKDGVVSNFLVNNAYPGMELEMTAVMGNFVVEPSADRKRHLITFAAGSGITPIMSMIKTILYKEDESVISLVYSNRKTDTIIFGKELSELQRAHTGRLKIYFVITDEKDIADTFPLFYKGQLNKLVTKKLVKTLLLERDLPAEFYLCGPQGFMSLIEEVLNALGIDKAQIFKEHFFITNSREPAVDFDNLQPRHVVIRWNEKENKVLVEKAQSILDAALKNGLNLPYSCTQGQCGACRAILVKGEVKLRKNHILNEDELNEGQILLCQGFPVSEDILIKARS